VGLDLISLIWAPICLVMGLPPLGLMLGICFVGFLVYPKLVFHIISTCLPVNGKTPKHVESISYKP
jgi:hypothetical protein